MADEQKQQKKQGKKKDAEQSKVKGGSDARKRAAYGAAGRDKQNKIRKNVAAVKKADPTAHEYLTKGGLVSKAKLVEITIQGDKFLDRRNDKKAAAYARPEARERRKANDAARKLRQAARRGNLEALKGLKDDPAYPALKHEATLASNALTGEKKAIETLEAVYPETYRAIRVRINGAVDAKKAAAEAAEKSADQPTEA